MSKSIKTSILFFLLLLGSFGYGQNLPKKLIPNIGISNQTPIKNLLVGETFTAGDFPIKILEISGASGSFSGKGYVTVPYLNDTKIAVAFENIKINTNYQLIDGVVETAYDASWSNVQDVEPLIDIINELIKEIESFLTNYTGSDEDKAKAIEFHRQQDELSKTVIDNPNLELELKTKIEKGTENAQQSWVALENKVPCADSQKKDENTKGGPSFENDNFNKDFDCYKKSINETVNSIKEGALALDKNALDGKAVPPINQEKTNTKPPIQDVKITRTLLNEIQRACTVDDGLSIKIGMTKSMTKAGEFYAYCKANSGTFYYYKGDKYWYINGNWFLETSCNFETCIKTCVKINADGTGVYEEIALEQGEATVVTAANFVVKTILVDTPLLIFGGGTKASTITINAIGTIAIEIFNRREDITNNEALISQVALLITTHKLDAQTPAATRKLAQNLIEKIERAFKNTTLSKEEVIREVEKMMGKVVQGAGKVLDDVVDDVLFESLIKEVKYLPGPQLPQKIASTFEKSFYTNRKLLTKERFFKYHGIDNRTGRKFSWLTNQKYPTEKQLREGLAIRDDWGVKIEFVSEFEVPAGTWISEGKAASQGVGYSGGDYQNVITNVPKSWILKTETAFK